MFAQILASLVLISIAAAIVLAGLRFARLTQARPAKVNWFAGLAATPRRFQVDVHHRVARHRPSAIMHATVAVGFLGSLLVAVPILGFGVQNPRAVLIAHASLALMAFGGALAWLRRQGPTRPRLSGGAYKRLPLAFVALAAGFLTANLAPPLWEGAPVLALVLQSAIVAAIGWACIELIVLAPSGPLSHAIAGTLYLATHPRPKRFSGPDTALDASKGGAETMADFPWNRLLGFLACVECGRCKLVCPMLAAGQPLNPKKLIQVLSTTIHGEGRDVAYRSGRYPRGRPLPPAEGGMHRPVVGEKALVHPDTIWACTTCRACVEACPMLIEHIDAVVDLRRAQVTAAKPLPGEATAVLDNLHRHGNAAGRPADERPAWGDGLDLPLAAPGKPVEVLLWQGEGAFLAHHHGALRAVVALLRAADVDFAVLGAAERDCGDLPRRLGDEPLFHQLATENMALLARFDFQRIVTLDPHVVHSLVREYPWEGDTPTVLHHSAFLAELIDQGRLTLGGPVDRAVTYHDPCYLARYLGEIDAPRQVLATAGCELREMAAHGRDTTCCGAGGGAAHTAIAGGGSLAEVRAAAAAETADFVAVACPHCAGSLAETVAVRDIAELLLDRYGVIAPEKK